MGSHVQKKTSKWFDFQPVMRGPDITKEGTVYWVSFENEDLWMTKDMATEVLEFLDPTKHYKLFTVIGPTPSDRGKTIVHRDGVSAGALHGIYQEMS